MEQELIQAAISTFCAVPEVYQAAFRQLGADFPDELVQAVKTKPQEALAMVQQDPELLQSIVAVYQQNSDEINTAAQQSQQTSLFKKGGKLAYGLRKYQIGGITLPKAKPFESLPTLVTNENNIPVLSGNFDDPKVRKFLNDQAKKRYRQFTISEPTTEARINNTTNQTGMLWSPEQLPERRNSITWDYRPGMDIAPLPKLRKNKIELGR